MSFTAVCPAESVLQRRCACSAAAEHCTAVVIRGLPERIANFQVKMAGGHQFGDVVIALIYLVRNFKGQVSSFYPIDTAKTNAKIETSMFRGELIEGGQRDAISQIWANACSKSEIISSASSIPREILIRLSLIPIESRSSGSRS